MLKSILVISLIINGILLFLLLQEKKRPVYERVIIETHPSAETL